MRILAVDDDPIILALLSEVLSKVAEHEVTCCESAHAAIRTVEQVKEPFDCILLDIQMPETDGIQLCRLLREIPAYAHAPILMITAMSDKSYMTRAFEAGATDYITKPFDIMELSTRISVANRIVRERKVAAERTAMVHRLRKHQRLEERPKLDQAISVSEVDRMIDFNAFENYLLRVPRGSLFRSSLFVIGINDVRRLYYRTSEYEFVGAISDVAEAISNTMKPATFLLTYAGNGLFACLLEGVRDVDTFEINRKLFHAIEEMGLSFGDGRPMPVSTEIGRAYSVGLRSGRAIVDMLIGALAEIETRVLGQQDQASGAEAWLKRKGAVAVLQNSGGK